MIVLLFVEYIILTVQDNWNVHDYFSFFIHSFQLLTSVVNFNLSLETCDHCGEDIEAFYMKNSSLLGHQALESKISFNKLHLSYNEVEWDFRQLTLFLQYGVWSDDTNLSVYACEPL